MMVTLGTGFLRPPAFAHETLPPSSLDKPGKLWMHQYRHN